MKKTWLCLILAALLVLGVPACSAPASPTTSSGTTTATTATSNTTTTTATSATTTATTGTTSATTTAGGTTTTGTAAGGTLPEVGIAITTHNQAAMAAYKDLCLFCHGPTTVNSNPYPPSWDGAKNGSTAFPGVYAVAAGSPQDHTNYTNAQCTQANCHAPPTS